MAGYLDEDDQMAALLAPTFNPPDPQVPDTARTGTSAGVAPQPQPYAQGTSRPPDNGAVRSITPPPQAAQPVQPQRAAQPPTPAVPAAATPSGNPTGAKPTNWGDSVRAGLTGQMRNADAANQTVASLASQPDLATTTAPIEAQRTQLAQPIDPSQAKYKPGLATRIFRGIDAVRRGGVLAAFDPGDVGATPYGAPNKQFGIDTAMQTQKVAAADQQLSQAASDYKAASDRAKALAQEQRSTATSYNDVTKGATSQEQEENKAGQDAEAVRHNQQDETLKGQQEAQTGKYQQGQLAVDRGKLGVEQQRVALEAKQGGPGGQAALDRETKQFGSGWEKSSDAANTQLEKIADARAMVNGNAESQALGIPKVLTALVGGQGTGVRITTPELNAIAKARGVQGDAEGFINKLSGKGSLTETQQQQLTQILDDVKQRITQKQEIASEALDGIYNGGTREDIIKAHETGRQKLADLESGKSSSSTPEPSGKAVSLSDARQLPQFKGKSDDEIRAAAQKYGHQVIP